MAPRPSGAVDASKVLVLDFDGVVCDGFEECALVTWNGAHGLGIEAFGDEGLRRIPAAYLERFRQSRPFARHLGHFMVALVETDAPLLAQKDFDRVYSELAPAQVEDFIRDVSAYRAEVRTHQNSQWLSYHQLYVGIDAALRDTRRATYIVTAKDAGSVSAILTSCGLTLERDMIFGDQREKVATLERIAGQEDVGVGDVCFVDDSLPNVIQAASAGFVALWATWGYHAPSHVQLAAEKGIESVTLDEFVRQFEIAPSAAHPVEAAEGPEFTRSSPGGGGVRRWP